jgi:hypothetical protein
VFASCRTAVLRLVIFTLTLAQKFEISNLKLSLINSLFSFKVHITYLHEVTEQEEDIKRKRTPLRPERSKVLLIIIVWKEEN